MLKFILAARRKPGQSQERYFFEWGNIHVALMITTPTVMSTFRRYVQHFSISGIGDDMLLFPLSDMAWDNMADHWLESVEDLVLPFRSVDYPQRMQPHNFGDSAFVIQLMTGEELFAEGDFYAGGVKLVHFLQKRPEITSAEFDARFRDHARLLLDAGASLIRKYVQSRETTGDPEHFKGTLFEQGDVNQYAGMEEIWLPSVPDIARLCRGERRAELLASYASFAGAETFSMVVTERVVFDFVTPGHVSPQPAILDPDSLEAAINLQGYRGWNVPGWEDAVQCEVVVPVS
jgi:hypothetical protein